jgi:hypothetical protein
MISSDALLSPDETKARNTLANIRWLKGRVSITTYFGMTRDVGGFDGVHLRTVATWYADRSGVGTSTNTQRFDRVMAIDSSIKEICETLEEQQLHARAWLLEHYAVPSSPVTQDEIVAMNIQANDEHQRARENGAESVGATSLRVDRHELRPTPPPVPKNRPRKRR